MKRISSSVRHQIIPVTIASLAWGPWADPGTASLAISGAGSVEGRAAIGRTPVWGGPVGRTWKQPSAGQCLQNHASTARGPSGTHAIKDWQGLCRPGHFLTSFPCDSHEVSPATSPSSQFLLASQASCLLRQNHSHAPPTQCNPPQVPQGGGHSHDPSRAHEAPVCAHPLGALSEVAGPGDAPGSRVLLPLTAGSQGACTAQLTAKISTRRSSYSERSQS